jgi:hypothetical protein
VPHARNFDECSPSNDECVGGAPQQRTLARPCFDSILIRPVDECDVLLRVGVYNLDAHAVCPRDERLLPSDGGDAALSLVQQRVFGREPALAVQRQSTGLPAAHVLPRRLVLRVHGEG